MSEKELLLQQIMALQELLENYPEKPKQTRRRISYKSPDYVVDYEKLIKVTGGYVHPEILDMYKGA